MKVLFVCHGNVGRSQSAMEYFKVMTTHPTDSAGTHASDLTVRIGDIAGARGIVAAMKEDGIDMSNNYPKQLTEDMLEKFDKVIVMTNADDTPTWLTHSPKYVYWDIQELANVPLEGVRAPRDQIKKLITALVRSL